MKGRLIGFLVGVIFLVVFVANNRPTVVDQRSIPSSIPHTISRRTGSASIGFASQPKLEEHFRKHGNEFPGLSMDEYLKEAQRVRDASVSDQVLEVVRKDGVVTRFDRSAGEFIAFDKDLTIRTFFKPNDGERYFRRQALNSY